MSYFSEVEGNMWNDRSLMQKSSGCSPLAGWEEAPWKVKEGDPFEVGNECLRGAWALSGMMAIAYFGWWLHRCI
jgi:hypothetical protein